MSPPSKFNCVFPLSQTTSIFIGDFIKNYCGFQPKSSLQTVLIIASLENIMSYEIRMLDWSINLSGCLFFD